MLSEAFETKKMRRVSSYFGVTSDVPVPRSLWFATLEPWMVPLEASQCVLARSKQWTFAI